MKKQMKVWRRSWAALAATVLVATACGGGEPAEEPVYEENVPPPISSETVILATTSIFGDIARNVAGDRARVDVMMPVGTDPHDFVPSADLVNSIYRANLVVSGGFALEERMTDVLDIAMQEGVNLFEIGEAALADFEPVEAAGGDSHDHDEEAGEDAHDHEGEAEDSHDEAAGEDAHDHEGEAEDSHDEAAGEDSHDHEGEDHDEAGEGDHDHDEEAGEDAHDHDEEAGEDAHDHEGEDHDEAAGEDAHDHDEEAGEDAHDHEGEDHDEAGEDSHDHDEEEAGEDSHDHDEEEAGEDSHDHDEEEAGEAGEGDHDHEEEAGGDSHDHEEEAGGDSHDDHDHAHAHGTDPHFWMDPILVAEAALALGEKLTPFDGSEEWMANAQSYADQMTALDMEIREILAAVPPERRKLITGHDSFGYFAQRYGFEVLNTIIPSTHTLAEPGSAHLAELVGLITEHGIPAIFVDIIDIDSPDLGESLAAEVGSGVRVVELFTGSLGAPGSGAETLISMLRTNAQRIAEALG